MGINVNNIIQGFPGAFNKASAASSGAVAGNNASVSPLKDRQVAVVSGGHSNTTQATENKAKNIFAENAQGNLKSNALSNKEFNLPMDPKFAAALAFIALAHLSTEEQKQSAVFKEVEAKLGNEALATAQANSGMHLGAALSKGISSLAEMGVKIHGTKTLHEAQSKLDALHKEYEGSAGHITRAKQTLKVAEDNAGVHGSAAMATPNPVEIKELKDKIRKLEAEYKKKTDLVIHDKKVGVRVSETMSSLLQSTGHVSNGALESAKTIGDAAKNVLDSTKHSVDQSTQQAIQTARSAMQINTIVRV